MSTDQLRDQLQATLGTAYTLDRELGGGGMSRVFVAQENRLKRNVVVKVLSPELAAGVSAERFEREIRLAAALQQANIVPLLSAGDTNGLPFYTMPFVDGLTLRARLARSGAMPVAEVVSVLRDVTRALAYAHEHGVVHRDIKPENILLSGDAAVVTDFGIAKALSASRTKAPGGTLTQVGTSIGTPAYMAPEQAAGDPSVDHRADIYALGCVAYEMLTGAPPFANRPPHQIFAAHLTEAPAPIATKRTDAPRELATLVMRSLEKDASRRPQSARELLQALDATPSGERATGRSRRRTPLIAAGVTLLVMGAAAFYMIRQRGGGAVASSDHSIAVLPFATGGDSAQVYFAEGVADELTTALARLPGLRVASRSAAFSTARRSASAQDAGRALHVATVLEGSVRRSGRKLRITAQLTSVADGFALWADAFERDTGDVFSAQDDLSRHITAALHDKLSLATHDSVTTDRGTRDKEAYDLYLRGRYLWARRGQDNLLQAARAFSTAIERDPSFARAWAGLAMAQVVLPEYLVEGRGDTLIAAGLKSAEHAIVLDGKLGDAHLARAYGLISRWEWAESEASFQRALALDPSNPAVHQWHGDLLVALGRIPESMQEMKEARRLDPASAIIASELGSAYYFSRRYEEALVVVRQAFALDSSLGILYTNAAATYSFADKPDSALAMLTLKTRVLGVPLGPREMSVKAALLARVGRVAEARRIAADLDKDAQSERISFFWAGAAHAAIGDVDDAMLWLGRSIDRREADPVLIGMSCDPLYDPIRSDPRYHTLLARLKIGECRIR